MIGRVNHVGARFPSARCDRGEHASARLVDQFVFDVSHRVDFANLIISERARNESSGAAFEIPESPLVPVQPMTRLLSEYLFNFLARPGMPRRQIEVAPVDPARLSLGRIPRMMRIRKAHTHTPIVCWLERIQKRDRALSHPVSMVVLTRNRIVLDLGER